MKLIVIFNLVLCLSYLFYEDDLYKLTTLKEDLISEIEFFQESEMPEENQFYLNHSFIEHLQAKIPEGRLAPYYAYQIEGNINVKLKDSQKFNINFGFSRKNRVVLMIDGVFLELPLNKKGFLRLVFKNKV